MKNYNIQYYVEGDDEKKLLNVLKTQLELIRPGKVQKLNVVNEYITDIMLRTFKKDTWVILVFDTDTNAIEILQKNIKKLKQCPFVSKVITVPQVKNLEDELVRSCKIKKVTQLLNSRSLSSFKSDLIHISNLDTKLLEHEFDIRVFWTQQPPAPYQKIPNEAYAIKLLKDE